MQPKDTLYECSASRSVRDLSYLYTILKSIKIRIKFNYG